MEKQKSLTGEIVGSDSLRDYFDGKKIISLHDDNKHFELLVMEVMQYGLGWLMILKKSDAIRRAFADFDYIKIAAFTEQDIRRALETRDMIHSERKIRAVVSNAQVFLDMQKQYGSFDEWLWAFADGGTVTCGKHMPQNEISDKISLELKRKGMKYIESATIYAHLQAAGIISDHNMDCWLYRYVNNLLTMC